MITFILNQERQQTSLPAGSSVLDYIREQKRLKGTKTGCREGDCGACTVLVGSLVDGKMQYQSMTSCLMPLGNAQGKHIVTVEGINMGEKLSPVQAAMVETNGTQCGFCTIGFIMSFTGFVMSEKTPNLPDAIAAIDGNICRCTGYKSIERAAAIICEKTSEKNLESPIKWAVGNNFIPAYFAEIPAKLSLIQSQNQAKIAAKKSSNPISSFLLAGGTDLLVQKPEKVEKSSVDLVFQQTPTAEISLIDGICRLSGHTTATAFVESPIIIDIFPEIASIMKKISSTPIRNMATMAGNIVNASPIGDMTAFFLALDANLELWDSLTDRRRIVPLRQFFKGYKQIDKSGSEIIENIYFAPPSSNDLFSFEKVSKREHLDIATVNTACFMRFDSDQQIIKEIHLSAGGVAATPKYLKQTCEFLVNRRISTDVLETAFEIMQTEISPISDARGAESYKRLLLRQLVIAHFVKSFGFNAEFKSILTPWK
jgi:xanthine dehydrogenase small subunit